MCGICWNCRCCLIFHSLRNAFLKFRIQLISPVFDYHDALSRYTNDVDVGWVANTNFTNLIFAFLSFFFGKCCLEEDMELKSKWGCKQTEKCLKVDCLAKWTGNDFVKGVSLRWFFTIRKVLGICIPYHVFNKIVGFRTAGNGFLQIFVDWKWQYRRK